MLSPVQLQNWVEFVDTLLVSVRSLAVVFVQSLSHVWLFTTPWTAAPQASLSVPHHLLSLPKFMSIESVMSSNHLILCRLLLLLPSVFPRIRVFSSESALHIRWSKCIYLNFKILLKNAKHCLTIQGYHKYSICKKQKKNTHYLWSVKKVKHSKNRYACSHCY